MKEVYKLDNPVWNSLNEVHKAFSIVSAGMVFYNPTYCRFGSLMDESDSIEGMAEYANAANSFFLVGRKPVLDNSWRLNKAVVCNQMLLEEQIALESGESIIELVSENQKADLFNLINLVQPGYFVEKTAELGNYYGIYKDDKLIAVTGERMKMNKYTEISAVVTHPEHTRKGYAKQLVSHVSNKVLMEGKSPYLHVSEMNIGAIKLYKKLGFKVRRKMTFWNLQKS